MIDAAIYGFAAGAGFAVNDIADLDDAIMDTENLLGSLNVEQFGNNSFFSQFITDAVQNMGLTTDGENLFFDSENMGSLRDQENVIQVSGSGTARGFPSETGRRHYPIFISGVSGIITSTGSLRNNFGNHWLSRELKLMKYKLIILLKPWAN